MKLYEELVSLRTKTPNWKTDERKRTLSFTIHQLMSLEPTNEELLQNDLTISKPALLEYVLHQMKINTTKYLKQKQTISVDEEKGLKETLQKLISEDIDDENDIQKNCSEEPRDSVKVFL